MPTPLHEAKAGLFRALGHPVRVRVLELLLAGPRPVKDLIAEIPVTPASLSQQLGVLKNAGILSDERQGSTVVYTLISQDLPALFADARAILASMLADQIDLLRELADEASQAEEADRP